MRLGVWTAPLILLATLWPGTAWAQLAGRYGPAGNIDLTGISSAIRDIQLLPGDGSTGVRLGSLVARPEAGATAGFDDNVLGTRKARGSAFVATQAVLQAGSDRLRNNISARMTVDDLHYLDQPRQSHTEWTARLDASYEIGRDTATLRYEHQNLNQTPRDLNVPQLDVPIAYRVDDVQLAYEKRFNRLALRPSLDVTALSYDDGSVAGQPYRQGYRDRTTLTPAMLATYELAPQRYLVGVVGNGIAAFRRPLPGASLLDYNDVFTLGGIDYDGGGLFRVRALAGYEARSFSNPSLKSIQAPVAELTLIYRLTKLTMVTTVVTRRIADSADETTTGVTKTGAVLTVDHEYLRNVLLKATGGLSLAQYGRSQGEQTLITAGAGATWLVNHKIRLTAAYDLQARQSHLNALLGGATQPGAGQPTGGSFNSNRYSLQLSIRL